ncbi:DUF3082 domain-containing protein [Oscillatoria salina]|uniref:DUF3082 domain-containing protein n=1 Tax=Oscillatoria salina TaxID=331517 RepID=UPI0013B868D6|nr:DUF3082 domain-containing protein [Oscillatoria salina]MBZ8182478.1 DUF3082 domain-containing protein [Oscillatoria salina IIICB1]NET90002.1 DUF3082 domain-containing protein [Kamptonema sp. SIO1D9]
MSNPEEQTKTKSLETVTSNVGPGRCLVGSLISGGFGFALYSLTSAIAQTFADKPIASTNPTAISISVAVRTLVVGVAALGTGVFALVAVGLIALAIQLFLEQSKKPTADEN